MPHPDPAPAVVPPRRAAFLDRDGVLNRDLGYVVRRQDFHWLPGACEALSMLQADGHALVVVTNQSGVARGYYTLDDVDALHRHMAAELRARGVGLAGVYACPHLPQGSVGAYAVECDCRKPAPGMIERAARELGLDLAASCLFGDKPSDIEAGRRAGVGRCWRIDPDDPSIAGARGPRIGDVCVAGGQDDAVGPHRGDDGGHASRAADRSLARADGVAASLLDAVLAMRAGATRPASR